MQIKPPGMFSRGKIVLERAAPHITPDSLLAELTNAWGGRGATAYKSALIGLDVALKKSGWTGIALKIKQNNGMTEIAYNAFSPSAFVRMLGMGLIPILIINSTSWGPFLREFEKYVQASPFFTGGQLGAGAMAQLPQAVAHYPQGVPQQQQQQGYGQQPQYAQQQQPQQQQPPQQQAQPQYPCATCGTTLQWVAEHQRWWCGRCQQYR